MYDNSLELCNKFKGNYYSGYKTLSEAKKRKLSNNYNPTNVM